MSSASLTGGTSSMELQTINGIPMAMHMSNMISNGAAQNSFSSGQLGIASLVGTSQNAQNAVLGSFSTQASNISGNSNHGMSLPLFNVQAAVTTGISSGEGTMMPTPGIAQQVAAGMQSIEATNSSTANMSATASQSSPAKYVRVWEGCRSASASETHYDGKVDFLVFKALNQHGFLGQLQEKKLLKVSIPSLRYCTKILASLPFTTPDEPLYLIYTINRVLQVRYGSLEATMKALSSRSIQEDKHAILDENGVLQHDSSVLQQEPYSSAHSVSIHIKEEDAILCSPTLGVSCGILKDNLQSNQADCQVAIALQLLLKLKRHLKIAFSLSNARCQDFSPNDPLKPGEGLSRQNIPFDISGTYFSLPTSHKEIIERYQTPSDSQFVKVASCASMSYLFIRFSIDGEGD
ncbi:hypothetical protein GIB67_010511 [Kingdonia uniflora]|uniref:Sister chromatid cohesion protein n=1 Tax=Kingdonia uniflora TaxID=39325 RepID=A0A7J7MAN1_9MAGN|nr:hypothetical protein GIB67_010511 [Kingdonia uniflora]